MLNVGDGGAGPGYYGLAGIGTRSPVHQWLAGRPADFLARQFPFLTYWCPRCSRETMGDALGRARAADPLQGSIFIADHGCTVFARLVVTGAARGTVWVEDLGGGNGIWPYGDECECCDECRTVAGVTARPTKQRFTFSEWYDDWLTRGLREGGVEG